MIEMFAGFADSEKSGAITVTEIGVVWISVPLVPVTTTVAVPAAAVLDAVKVTVLPLRAALTPAGVAPTLKVTVPANPPRGVTVIALDADGPPAVIATLAGLAESEKSWLVIASVMVVLCVRLPLTPVMVTVNAPLGAVADAAKVSVLVPVVDCGLKVAVTPEGTPLALRFTLPAKLPDG